MKDCKGARDVIPNLKLMDIVNDEKLTDTKQIKKFQSILGCARWLFRCTRIDIGYAVHMMSAASTNPTKNALRCAIQLLRYLKHTKHYTLNYSKEANNASIDETELRDPKMKYNPHCPCVFTDSNWGVPKSVSSTITMFIHGAVSWDVHFQETVALSSVQAELIALSDGMKRLFPNKMKKSNNNK